MLRSIVNVAKALLLVVVVVALVGCASSKVKKENDTLKQEIMKLQDTSANLDQENKRLAEDKAALETELAKTKSSYIGQEDVLRQKAREFEATGLPVTVREGMVIVTMPQALLYSSGSAKITKSGATKLAQVAKIVNSSSFRDFQVEIQGHTDTDPIHRTKNKYEDNWELSYVRAKNVVDYLIDHGKVSGKRIHVAAYGQYDSVASNTTSAGKARNRRVEIVLLAPTGKAATAKTTSSTVAKPAAATAPAEPAPAESSEPTEPK